jgi:excisionase family DNA binding protein
MRSKKISVSVFFGGKVQAGKSYTFPSLTRQSLILLLMDLTELKEQLDRIEAAALSQKNVLTLEEATRYIGISHSDMYKRTSNREIPHYKPRGKMVYFDRIEIENYLKQNPIATYEEIEQQAINHCVDTKRR